MLEIYSDFFQKGVLESIKDDHKALDPFGVEILKPCGYHDSTDYIIKGASCFSTMWTPTST